MTPCIVITLGLPHKRLSPNHKVFSKGGMMAKRVAVKRYRDIANTLGYEQAAQSWVIPLPWHKATIRYDFYHKVKRDRDATNLVGSMKPAEDGLVDAEIIVDDNTSVVRHDPPVMHIDKQNPRVVITVTEGWGDTPG